MRHFGMLLLLLLFSACDGPDTPLDADTRSRIDSIANAQMRQARIDIDSMCVRREKTDLPRLVDSFKQVRLQEIQEQLKTITK